MVAIFIMFIYQHQQMKLRMLLYAKTSNGVLVCLVRCKILATKPKLDSRRGGGLDEKWNCPFTVWF